MNITLKISAIIVLSLMLLAIFTLFLNRSKPVIYALFDSSEVERVPLFTIFNPFRDKETEKAAKGFLDKISKGKCEDVLKNLKNYEESTKRNICLNEAKYPIMEVKLIMIEVKGINQKLTFIVKRQGYSGSAPPVTLTLRKVSDTWDIIGYEAIY